MNYILKSFLIGCCVGVGISLILFIVSLLVGGGLGFTIIFILPLVFILGIVFPPIIYSGFVFQSPVGLILAITLFLSFFGLWGAFIGVVSKYIKLRKKNYGK